MQHFIPSFHVTFYLPAGSNLLRDHLQKKESAGLAAAPSGLEEDPGGGAGRKGALAGTD
jgi:hypothetical protein